MNPIFHPSPVLHRNFVQARDQTEKLVRSSPGGKVIALVGPTQAGKSLIFNHVEKSLREGIQIDDTSAMPVVSFVVGTSQDGRISPKHLTLKVLKILHHPIYMHIGDLDERDHYRPSRGSDEGTLRIAVEHALEARSTIHVNMDEAHHLTHTRDPVVRGNVLQSIKCFSAIERTLFLCGGYELAYQGLFDSAHFAGRLVCVECEAYTDSDEDFEEWLRILKSLSSHMAIQSKALLIDHAEELLRAASGSFGLLEKILWAARARSGSGVIDRNALMTSFPTKREYEAIQKDIARGKEALAILPRYEPVVPTSQALSPRLRRKRPFRRNPNRNVMQAVKVADHE